VTAQATLPNGRSDESTGAVPIARLQGENLANALMKAETKAKRRVTLSICGLSVLDESELDGVREQVHPASSGAQDEMTSLDPDVAEQLSQRMKVAEVMLAGCDSYGKALLLRDLLGTSDRRSKLTIDIQAAYDPQKPASTWLITPDQHRALGRTWQSVHRKCAKLEKELAPSAEASFADVDEADPAEEFSRE